MLVVVGMLALILLAPACASAQDLDQRIPARPGGSLQVDLDMGEEARPERVSLEVRSHDADEVWAVADLSGVGASTVKFRVEHDDRTVRLYGRAGGVMSWLFGGPGVTVRVWVPREFSVDLRSASGPIRIEDVKGSIRARTTDAAIDVRGAEGPIHLRTGTGDIILNESEGDVVARATTGSIEVVWLKGSVSARTGAGDLRLRHVDGKLDLRTDDGEVNLREVKGPVEVHTERGAVYALFSGDPEGHVETRRGSVVVAMPGHAGTQLDARADEGTVEIEPGLKTGSRRARDRFRGAINGGGPDFQVYTARGTISVGRR